MVVVIIFIIFILGVGGFFEKSDYKLMKEAEKLPSFTKEEAAKYYYNELKRK
jgi:uncharacterized membrane protein